jgi:hypothetical protein
MISAPPHESRSSSTQATFFFCSSLPNSFSGITAFVVESES